MAIRLRSAALVLALLLALEITLAAHPPATTVPLSRCGRAAVAVAAMIGRAGPFRMLLDTGSSRTAISSRVAAQLRAPIRGGTMMVTPAGSTPQPLTVLPTIRIGALAADGVTAMVLPPAALPHGREVDGLIGQDVLADRVYTIDYEARTVTWHGDRPPADGVHLPLVVEGGLPFVMVRPSASATRLRLLADSGADVLVLFEPRNGVQVHARTQRIGLLRTPSGTRTGRELWFDEFDLGDVTLRDQRALLLGRNEPNGMPGDGLLPLHLFARVTVDGPGRALIVATR